MPWKPAAPCAQYGCGALVKSGRYCDAHKEQAQRNYRREDSSRKSSTQRGYNYSWQQFRARYLSLYPLCVDCKKAGRYTAASDVHHIEKLVDAPERKYDDTNLMPLCGDCHKARTARGE